MGRIISLCPFYFIKHKETAEPSPWLKNEAGETIVTYTYDAWGKLLERTNTQLADYNPLRYRGYVYDFETGLYYLQSRYYNPEWGRFINADGLVSTGQGFVGNNMFAYCNNNAINSSDPDGFCQRILWGFIKFDCKSTNCPSSKNYIRPKSVEPIGSYNNGKGLVYVVKPDKVSTITQNIEDNAVIIVDKRVNSDDSEYNQDIQVYNSYKITSLAQQKEIIKLICQYNDLNQVTPGWDRSEESMLIEWEAHNLAYYTYSKLNKDGKYTEEINSAMHVDFDNNGENKYSPFN